MAYTNDPNKLQSGDLMLEGTHRFAVGIPANEFVSKEAYQRTVAEAKEALAKFDQHPKLTKSQAEFINSTRSFKNRVGQLFQSLLWLNHWITKNEEPEKIAQVKPSFDQLREQVLKPILAVYKPEAITSFIDWLFKQKYHVSKETKAKLTRDEIEQFFALHSPQAAVKA